REQRETRPEQVVRDDHRIEALVRGEGPRPALQVGDAPLDAVADRVRRSPVAFDDARERRLVAIDGEHAQPARGRGPRMAPGAGGEIEHAGAAGDPVEPAEDPRRSVGKRAVRWFGLGHDKFLVAPARFGYSGADLEHAGQESDIRDAPAARTAQTRRETIALA